MESLGEVAEVVRGPTTGYNDFFILSKEKAKEWGIEPAFLVPCVSSPKKLKGLVIRPEDVDEYFFMCDKPKEELKGTNALKYIEYGEKLEVEVTRGSKRERRRLPELETLKGRKLWYSLPRLPISDILFPKMMRGRIQLFLNNAKAQAVHVFSYVITKDADLLASYMSSSVSKALLEIVGRQYTGMFDVETGDLCKLPVVEKAEIKNDKKDVKNAFCHTV